MKPSTENHSKEPTGSKDSFTLFLEKANESVQEHIRNYFPTEITLANVENFVGPAVWEHELKAYTSVLSTPVWDLISRKGKCWRPVFGMLMLRVFGKDCTEFDQLICVCSELIHTGALIIDDIEDSSRLRRGEETIHLKYGLDVALNAGNTLYFLPIPLVIKHPRLSDTHKFQLLKIFNNIQLQAHLGQSADIYWSLERKQAILGRAEYGRWQNKVLQMYAYKTAAAVVGLAEACGVITDQSDRTLAVCRDYGYALGVAFQIIDDLHNFSRDPRWRKSFGEDVREGKMTYVVLEALKQLSGQKRKNVISILQNIDLRQSVEGFEEAIELIRESGALARSYEFSQKLLSNAWTTLSEHIPDSQYKNYLEQFGNNLVDLAYEV